MDRHLNESFIATARCIDPQIGLASTDGREGLYRRLLLMFEQGQHDVVERIREAESAGDRVGAIRHAHNIRAGAGTLGMVELAEVAMRLEAVLRDDPDPSLALMALLDDMSRALEPVLTVLRGLRAAAPDAPLLALLS